MYRFPQKLPGSFRKMAPKKNANIANCVTAYTELHLPEPICQSEAKSTNKVKSSRTAGRIPFRHRSEALRPTFPGGVPSTDAAVTSAKSSAAVILLPRSV